MSSADLADMLHRIRRALISRGVADTTDPSNQPMVINARVPLVMFADAASGVAVDISVCNHCGAFKSRCVCLVLPHQQRRLCCFRINPRGVETCA
jgi:hypothetical protein